MYTPINTFSIPTHKKTAFAQANTKNARAECVIIFQCVCVSTFTPFNWNSRAYVLCVKCSCCECVVWTELPHTNRQRILDAFRFPFPYVAYVTVCNIHRMHTGKCTRWRVELTHKRTHNEPPHYSDNPTHKNCPAKQTERTYSFIVCTSSRFKLVGWVFVRFVGQFVVQLFPFSLSRCGPVKNTKCQRTLGIIIVRFVKI